MNTYKVKTAFGYRKINASSKLHAAQKAYELDFGYASVDTVKEVSSKWWLLVYAVCFGIGWFGFYLL